MPEVRSSSDDPSALISDAKIIEFVETHLPKFKKLCLNQDSDHVLIHQRGFGRSDGELFALAMAIKYAGIAQKHVTVMSDKQQ